MISAKGLTKLAPKWRKFAAMGRKRISFPRNDNSVTVETCSTSSVVEKGHFVVYTADKTRFVIPLMFLRNEIFEELLKMAEEEYGLPSDGPIMVPCDSHFMEYIIVLIRGRAADLRKGLLMPVDKNHCSLLSSNQVENMLLDTVISAMQLSTKGEQRTPQVITIDLETSVEHEELNPADAWLPITESRKGNVFTSASHLLCSGIGIQTLALPMAFLPLGWFWGSVCLSVALCWQLYTMWLLVNLHESPSGFRYSRYLHLSIAAFGEKLGKLLTVFPTMYLSGGTCVLYIITGGKTLEYLYQVVCGDGFECNSRPLRGIEWCLVFICLAVWVAQFFPNLESLANISLIGSITSIACCSLILIVLIINKGRVEPQGPQEAKILGLDRISNVINGIGIIALAFRGHNVVLEIQGTISTNRKQSSQEPMWRGVTMSYLLIAICVYPLSILGYRAFENMETAINIEHLFKLSTHKYIVGMTYLIVVINCFCAFQIYAMPVFDNLERLYTSRKNKPCPQWLRSSIKILFGGLTYCIAMAFPFLARLGAFMGAIALPLTLSYPCFMWVAMKKPCWYSKMWFINVGLGSLGIILSILLAAAALRSLVTDGVNANFFNPM